MSNRAKIAPAPRLGQGVMFITIEDETGVANLVVWEKMFEK